ncbi:MAG: 50S ribosomal protein L10 [candidate division KSB1 bacterium]|nr:50S ribosomal protein L10 [candidate division KSB1 bacterium]MDZ7295793.1 50S ribosomal protein L10 [candidate division KSB1 bacterium]MDZ7378227.1 50S ribosomal protein L10 [candidate division KSB1 bacterium]MDZ7384564.1 50S ribosomal protein L10 [candidate division KSB1 bacterium]MDZ7394011.1 50S ribosomal protein L10 [candidate division KSB1 bacterium]
MARPEKERVVAEVSEGLTRARGIYVTDFSGLNVEEVTELRKTLRDANVQYRVVKNTLARRSVRQAGYEALLPHLTGPTAFALSFDDPGVPARVLRDFAQKKNKLAIKAIVYEGELIDASRVDEICNLPPRNVMVARLLGTMNAPLTRLVYTLNGVLAQFVRVLDAIRAQKEGQTSL